MGRIATQLVVAKSEHASYQTSSDPPTGTAYIKISLLTPPTLVTTITRATTQPPHLTARSLGSCRVVERWSQGAALAHLPRPRPPNVTPVLTPSIADGHARPLKNEPKGRGRGPQYKRIGENMEDPTRVAITRRAFSGRRIVDGSARGRLRSSEM
jgi:hypothetical protein